jgi:hypothetical protein
MDLQLHIRRFFCSLQAMGIGAAWEDPFYFPNNLVDLKIRKIRIDFDILMSTLCVKEVVLKEDLNTFFETNNFEKAELYSYFLNRLFEEVTAAKILLLNNTLKALQKLLPQPEPV